MAIAANYETPLEVIEVIHPHPLSAGEVVGRNAFLIATAACLSPLASGLIVTGIHGGTTYYDCSTPFLSAISRLIEEQSDGAFRLLTPFADWSKADIISFARTSGVPLNLTYSCERGTTPPCGVCASCQDRRML
jgi:7-cyano-7-deazaguanine synthase